MDSVILLLPLFTVRPGRDANGLLYCYSLCLQFDQGGMLMYSVILLLPLFTVRPGRDANGLCYIVIASVYSSTRAGC